MDSFNFTLKKAIRFLAYLPLRSVNKMLKPIETILLQRSGSPKYPPIFIVGPARSGTTLIYQALTACFKTSYLSNLASYLNRAPLTATHLLRLLKLHNSIPSSYKSYYGKTPGIGSPSQGQEIWRHWFIRDSYSNIKVKGDKNDLINTVGGVERIYSAPFINKWPAFSVYIPEIANLFPNAVFIHVTRNYSEVAQSVLRGRIELKDDATKSISQLPDSAAQFQGLSYIEQVCAYVLGVENQIIRDLSNLNNKKAFIVHYEEFCQDPNNVIKKINLWYKKTTGFRLQLRTSSELEPFSISRSKKVSETDKLKIEKCLNKFLKKECFEHLLVK